jgi:hypothetical protein
MLFAPKFLYGLYNTISYVFDFEEIVETPCFLLKFLRRSEAAASGWELCLINLADNYRFIITVLLDVLSIKLTNCENKNSYHFYQ